MIEEGRLVYRYHPTQRGYFAVFLHRGITRREGSVLLPITGASTTAWCDTAVLQRAYWTFHGPVTDNVFIFSEPVHE